MTVFTPLSKIEQIKYKLKSTNITKSNVNLLGLQELSVVLIFCSDFVRGCLMDPVSWHVNISYLESLILIKIILEEYWKKKKNLFDLKEC